MTIPADTYEKLKEAAGGEELDGYEIELSFVNSYIIDSGAFSAYAKIYI